MNEAALWPADSGHGVDPAEVITAPERMLTGMRFG